MTYRDTYAATMNASHTGAEVVAVLRHNGKPVSFHRFHLPKYDEPGWYWAITSFNSLKERSSKQVWNIYYKGGRAEWPSGFHVSAWKAKDSPVKVQDFAVPEFAHKSLWEFYKAIGYDYKNKRYSSTR